MKTNNAFIMEQNTSFWRVSLVLGGGGGGLAEKIRRHTEDKLM